MGGSFGDLEQRQLERLRGELAEMLSANLAYPPFFDYRSGRVACRPVDRAKREELDDFVRSVNFAAIERADVKSPEVRRFLEGLFTRYIEINPALARPHSMRRRAQLCARVPRLAAELQRALAAAGAGQAQAFGGRRSPVSWADTINEGIGGRQDHEHNTRVLEAVLLRRDEASAPGPARPRSAVPTPGSRHPAPAPPPPPAPPGVGFPPPAPDFGAIPGSPFAGLEIGPQSAVFGSSVGLSEMDTSPLAAFGGAFAGANGTDEASRPSPPRELPPDLYRIYGDYLRDMQPEAPVAEPPAPEPPSVPVFPPPPPGVPVFPPPVVRTPASREADAEAAAAARSAPPPPVVEPAVAATPARSAEQARGDKLIFWQLRYQLEAYVRRAAGSYGVRTTSGDPSGVLDALRRSGYVDEADLRIAEGILALTDRVTASGTASVEDYRQALMLYLLYHRSHLG